MILNVSGRCDIPAFYSKWFMNRIQAGFVDVRNPFDEKRVSRIYFEDVDAFVFCTKNPIPMLEFLPQLNKPVILQVTLTPYKQDIEPLVPDKKQILEAIRKCSEIVGIDQLFVRYDPIFLSERYDLDYHKRAFERMCSLLEGDVKQIIVSFLDLYKNVKKNQGILKYREWTEKDYQEIGRAFSASAQKHGMSVQTCFEERDLTEFGFKKGACVSHELAYQLTGKTYKNWTVRQGKVCGCVQMADIGVYNSCMHFCKYCYANYDEDQVRKNFKKHDPDSSLLIGTLQEDDIIKVRKK